MKKKAFFSVLIFALILTLTASLPLIGGRGGEEHQTETLLGCRRAGAISQQRLGEVVDGQSHGKDQGPGDFSSLTGEHLWLRPAGHIDLLEKGMVEVILGCRIYTPGKFPLGSV